MSNQLRFEGNDLESLLSRARAEVGDDARIVAANRLRKGGVGGFFAREVFEVIVEPSEVEEDLKPATKLGRARKRDTAEQPLTVPVAAQRAQRAAVAGVNANKPRRAAKSVLDVLDDEDEVLEHQWSADRDDDMIDLRSDRAETQSHVRFSQSDTSHGGFDDGEPQEVSTQSERFAQILERLAIATERPGTLEGVGSSNAPYRDEISIVDRDSDHSQPEPDARFDTYSRSSATPRFADDSVTFERTQPTRSATDIRYERVVAASQAPETVVDHDELIERPEGIFVRFGLPARYVPRGVSGTALRGALIESLECLPVAEPLPQSRGVTVAIIGVGARPVALARILAAEHGIDPDTVVIATEQELGNGVPAWSQITDGPTAQERRRSWRRRDHVSFVAVSVTTMTAATEWTNMMLDHLEPTQVWAVANAGWKAEDVSAWAQRLGGVDVLAIERLDETVSPASLLEVGVPVARIDGEPASPARWAELLLDRVVVS